MRNLIRDRLLKWAAQLRYPRLLMVTVGLFVIDMLIPDFIPFGDEILLGLIALALSRWKKVPDIRNQKRPLGEDA